MTVRGPQPQPGDVVGDGFRLERLVGTGGMGAVWSATVVGTHDRVALKFLHGQMAADPLMVQRFLFEARAGAEVVHPNVVRVVSSGWIPAAADGDAAIPWLAMELLEGRTLADVLRPRARLDAVDALALAVAIAAGTGAAHRAGIVHRDIKPANVFLHEERADVVVPKVLDFGISKFVDPSLDGGLTTTGALIGSAMYMSPEQATGGHNVDVRTDVWALGVLLYRTLTGESPIPGVQAEVISSLATPQDLSLAALRNPLVPPDAATIVRRCLRKKREERYDSAVELEADLRAALAATKGTPRLAQLLRPSSSAATVISAPVAECGDGETTAARTAPTGVVIAQPPEAAPLEVPEVQGSDRRRADTAPIARARTGSSTRTAALVAAASGVLAFAAALGAWWLLVRTEPPPAPPALAAAPPAATETAPAPSEAPSSTIELAEPAEPGPGAPARSHARVVGKPRPPPPPATAHPHPAAPKPSPPAASAPDPWRRPGF